MNILNLPRASAGPPRLSILLRNRASNRKSLLADLKITCSERVRKNKTLYRQTREGITT